MPTCLRCVAARRPCDYPAPREGSVKKRGGSAKAKEDKSGATSKSPSAKIVTPAGGIVVNGHQSGNLNASTLSLLPNFLTAVSDERHTSMQHPHPVAIRPTSSDGGSQSFHQEDPLAGIMIAPTQLAARVGGCFHVHACNRLPNDGTVSDISFRPSKRRHTQLPRRTTWIVFTTLCSSRPQGRPP
jgi:hypothetical protein